MGYHWTEQFAGLLSLAKSSGFLETIATDKAVVTMVEGLALMETDPMILGRRSKPLHIWATYCLGRPGVEPIAGLPRALLDLIALASRHRNNVEDIRAWASRLDPVGLSPAKYHIWQAYAIGTMLYMHLKWTAIPDYLALASTLRAHIDRFLETAPASGASRRLVIWPVYISGLLATDARTRSNVIKVLGGQMAPRFPEEKNPLCIVLKETWTRVDAGEFVAMDAVARELNIERLIA
jgi:hypothetical protein